MEINYLEHPLSSDTLLAIDATAKGNPYRCFVNNVEIKLVCYANTETGIVKTYDVFRDGKYHLTYEIFGNEVCPYVYDEVFRSREIETPLDSVLSEILRGKVELKQV